MNILRVNFYRQLIDAGGSLVRDSRLLILKIKYVKEGIVNIGLISTIVVIVYLFLCFFSSYWMSGKTRKERLPMMFLYPLWVGPFYLLLIVIRRIMRRKVKR